MSNNCDLLHYMTLGLYLEPLIHPKPGAVTIERHHKDKDVKDFVIHASIAHRSLFLACWASSRSVNPLEEGLRAYRLELAKMKITKNIALGSFLLMLPLASTLPRLGVRIDIDRIGLEATSIVHEFDNANVAREYYLILNMVKPTHLGVYQGPVPGVESGRYPEKLIDVLRVSRWDHIHREILEGYPITTRAAKWIAEEEVSIQSIQKTLLHLLAEAGDTLIAAKFGFKAYKKAIEEASLGLYVSRRVGVVRALEWLDYLWRERDWNPGSVLDIIAGAIGLAWLSIATSSGG